MGLRVSKRIRKELFASCPIVLLQCRQETILDTEWIDLSTTICHDLLLYKHKGVLVHVSLNDKCWIPPSVTNGLSLACAAGATSPAFAFISPFPWTSLAA